MKNDARRSCKYLAGAVLSIATPVALSQTAATSPAPPYPTRPIRLIVANPPGGGTDIFARALGQKLSESFRQSVVVDNRGGASETLGADIAAKAAPDGYTLIMLSSTHTITPSILATVPYDPVQDFAPVSQATLSPYLMGVHPSVPAKSVKEFIALARSKPSELNYASGGSGTAPHLASELLKVSTGIKLVHVPYKGGGPAVVALVSGEAGMLFNSLPAMLPQVKAGRIRALAVSSARRSPAVPELPTVAESGVPGFDVINWYGMAAPAKTPQPIVVKLHAEIVRLLQTPDLRARLANDGTDPVGSTPEEFTGFMKAEISKWARVVKASGARAD